MDQDSTSEQDPSLLVSGLADEFCVSTFSSSPDRVSVDNSLPEGLVVDQDQLSGDSSRLSRPTSDPPGTYRSDPTEASPGPRTSAVSALSRSAVPPLVRSPSPPTGLVSSSVSVRPSDRAFSNATADGQCSTSSLSGLLSSKLSDPSLDLSSSQSIDLLTYCIGLRSITVDQLRGKEAVIVLGKRGVGKSTFVHYLLGCSSMMHKLHSAPYFPDTGNSNQASVGTPSEDGCVDSVIPTDRVQDSSVFIPRLHPDTVDSTRVYCDCPCLLDNHGPELNISRSVHIRGLFQFSRCAKVIVLVNYHSLRSDRAGFFCDLLRLCTELFGSIDALSAHKDSLMLGITRVPAGSADLVDLRAWLLEGSPSIIASLCTHLFLYAPQDGCVGDYHTRRSLLSTLSALPSISKDSFSHVSRPVLSAIDACWLLSFLADQSVHLRTHFKAQRYGQSASIWRDMRKLHAIGHLSADLMLRLDTLYLQSILSCHVSRFRDASIHYRFSAARSYLSELHAMTDHFRSDDLSLLGLDMPSLSAYMSEFEQKKFREDSFEESLCQLSDRLVSLDRRCALLSSQLSSQGHAFSSFQERLHSEMLFRDSEYSSHQSSLRSEESTFLAHQSSVLDLYSSLSSEDHMDYRVAYASLRDAYSSCLGSSSFYRSSSRSLYERLISDHQSSYQSWVSSLRGRLSVLRRSQVRLRTSRRRSSHLPSIAFGSSCWREYFGVEVGEDPDLPSNIAAILGSESPFLLEGESKPQRVVSNHLLTLIPSKVDGVPLTLDRLGSLVLRNHSGFFTSFSSNSRSAQGYSSQGYGYYSEFLTLSNRQTPLGDASYWILLSKTVLDDSRYKSVSDHKLMVSQYSSSDYRLPRALEVATSLLAHYARSNGERLYANKNPKDYWTYTRCSDVDKDGDALAVGGFESSGLCISCVNVRYASRGVAAAREL